MHAEGSNGSVTINGDHLVIRRKGVANILTQGFQGEKSIPLKNVTAVQFRSASAMMAGYIQFTIMGGREFRGGMGEAARDENAVLFERKQEPAFQQLRQLVQNATSAPAPSQNQSILPAQQLAELASLVERGFVTREEFDAQKAQYLSGGFSAAPVVSVGAGAMTMSPPIEVKRKSYAKPLFAVLIIMWVIILMM